MISSKQHISHTLTGCGVSTHLLVVLPSPNADDYPDSISSTESNFGAALDYCKPDRMTLMKVPYEGHAEEGLPPGFKAAFESRGWHDLSESTEVLKVLAIDPYAHDWDPSEFFLKYFEPLLKGRTEDERTVFFVGPGSAFLTALMTQLAYSIGAEMISNTPFDDEGNRSVRSLAFAAEGADLIVFPELSLTGYPPEDLLLKPSFSQRAHDAVRRLSADIHDAVVLVGFPYLSGDLFNGTAVLADGQVRIDVAACGVNFVDTLFVQGLYQIRPEPLEPHGIMFGPAFADGLRVAAKFRGEKKGRRSPTPTFGVGLNGMRYLLRVDPAKGKLELRRNDAMVHAVDFKWQPNRWTHLVLQVRELPGLQWALEGKAWSEGETAPKMLSVGASAYSRDFDYAAMREIADEVGAILWVDMAHTAGLIAAKLLNDPLPHAHVVSTTTHKTLRGPRGGMILVGNDAPSPTGETWVKSGNPKSTGQVLDSAMFPGTIGGPLMHCIAAKAVAFGEALRPEFAERRLTRALPQPLPQLVVKCSGVLSLVRPQNLYLRQLVENCLFLSLGFGPWL
mgnify:CR=1 FL=1